MSAAMPEVGLESHARAPDDAPAATYRRGDATNAPGMLIHPKVLLCPAARSALPVAFAGHGNNSLSSQK